MASNNFIIWRAVASSSVMRCAAWLTPSASWRTAPTVSSMRVAVGDVAARLLGGAGGGLGAATAPIKATISRTPSTVAPSAWRWAC